MRGDSSRITRLTFIVPPPASDRQPMLLKTALQRLVSEVDPRRQKELHDACLKALERLDAEIQILQEVGVPSTSTAATISPPHPLPEPTHSTNTQKKTDGFSDTTTQKKTDRSSDTTTINKLETKSLSVESISDQLPIIVDNFWLPFKLACQPQNPAKLREVCLDLIQKLLAHQRLKGSHVIDYTPGNFPTKPSTSSNEVEAASKEPLSPFMLIDDIVHTVCMSSPLFASNGESGGGTFPGSLSQAHHPENAVQLQIIKVLLTAVTSASCEVHEASLLKCFQACFNIYLFSKNAVNQSTAKASLTQMCHWVFTKMETHAHEMHAGVAAEGAGGEYRDHEINGGESAVASSAFKNSNTPQIDGSSTSFLAHDDPRYDLLLRRDVFLTLRFFCRLSMKSDRLSVAVAIKDAHSNETIDSLSPVTIRTRLLGLELILQFIMNSGPVLQCEEPFLSIVKQGVTVSISKNGLLTHPMLFELSLAILINLLKFYKSTLKQELQILLNEIFMFVLENPNSMHAQKLMVLQAFHKVCVTAQSLVDIYLNYDCDLNMASVYEKLVASLSRLAQGCGLKVTVNPTSASSLGLGLVGFGGGGGGSSSKSVGVFGVSEQWTGITSEVSMERKLRGKALRCLAAICVSLAEWMKESASGNGTSILAAALVDATELSHPPTDSSNSRGSTPSVPSPSSPLIHAKPNSPPPLALTNLVLASKFPLHSISLNDLQPPPSAPRPSSNSGAPFAEVQETPDYMGKLKERKMILKQGVALFNAKPVKGLTFLCESGFFAEETDVDGAMVQFLRQHTELNKKAIGEILGDGGGWWWWLGADFPTSRTTHSAYAQICGRL